MSGWPASRGFPEPEDQQGAATHGSAPSRSASPRTASTTDSSANAPQGSAPQGRAPRSPALHRTASKDSSAVPASGATHGSALPGHAPQGQAPLSTASTSSSLSVAVSQSATRRTAARGSATHGHAPQGTASTTYVAVDGSWFTDKDVSVIGPALAVLAEADRLDAQSVIREAATAGTPINAWDQEKGYFLWDDKKAALRYRVTQAEKMIRSVVVRIESAAGSQDVRAFPRVAGDDAEGLAYRSWLDAYEDPAKVAQLGARFQGELQSVLRRYAAFRAVTGFAAQWAPTLDALEAAVEGGQKPKAVS